MEDKLLYKELSYKLRGVLFAIQNELGRFRNEKQYGDAFSQKLNEEGIKYEREKILPVCFAGERQGRNRLDFVVDGKIVIELKCVSCLSREDYHQCQRYLESTDLDLAFLVNFCPKYVLIRRILNHIKYNRENHP